MKRILIVRLSAIGDVVMSTGLVPALRRLHPDAELSWLVEPAAAPLLVHNPRIDRVIVWPRQEWQRLWRERRYLEVLKRFAAFRRALRQQRFDLAIDPQGLLKSAFWSRMSGAPRRVQLGRRERSHWLATEVVEPPADSGPRPIAAEYRELARHLGAPDGAFRLDLAVGGAARTRVQARLAAAGLQAGVTRYVALCPFTTRPQKHWFEERWQAVARHCIAAGLVPVLLGGKGDVPAGARIAAGVAGLVNLTGELALDETVAVIEGAEQLVGVDTGLTHMGIALQRPTTSLFGSTAPYTDAGEPRSAVLYDRLPCSPCHRHPTCDGRFDCMRALTVERVVERLGAGVGQPGAPRLAP